MTTVTIEEAQAKLPELIDHLAAWEELVITRNQQPIARLLAEEKPKCQPRKPGSAKGLLTILVEDNEHLKDFGGLASQRPVRPAAGRPGDEGEHSHHQR